MTAASANAVSPEAARAQNAAAQSIPAAAVINEVSNFFMVYARAASSGQIPSLISCLSDKSCRPVKLSTF